MLSKMTKLKISQACYAIVSSRFATFHNPVFVGPKFSWKEFPEMMADQCETEMFIYLEFPSRNKKVTHPEIRALAKEYGKEIATYLVQMAGYKV